MLLDHELRETARSRTPPLCEQNGHKWSLDETGEAQVKKTTLDGTRPVH
jgi:hypothetical protein